MAETILGHSLESSEDEGAGLSNIPAAVATSGWAAINETTTESSAEAASTTVVVSVPVLANSAQYIRTEGDNTVKKVIRPIANKRQQKIYKVRFEDGHIEGILEEILLGLPNGSEGLESLRNGEVSSEVSGEEDTPVTVQRLGSRTRPTRTRTANLMQIDDSSSESHGAFRRGARRSGRMQLDSGLSHISISTDSDGDSEQDVVVSDDESDRPRRSLRTGRLRKGRPSKPIGRSDRRGRGVAKSHNARSRQRQSSSEESESDYQGKFQIIKSDVKKGRKRKRQSASDVTARRSQRHHNTGNMAEVGEDEVYRSDSSKENTRTAKVIATKEVFKPVPRDDPFRARHMNVCDNCRSSVGDLVYCQGCSLAYHKNCLGNRSSRDHLVTKIGEEDFVLQCRRCVNIYRRRDPTAPDLARCQDCKITGDSCTAFRDRKSPAQEQKERDENGGLDPITHVNPTRINNVANVMFRCVSCSRGWHYHHLPPRRQWDIEFNDNEDRAENRFFEYSGNFRCLDCHQLEQKKISNLVAWRPVDVDAYQPDVPVEFVDEDEKEYLVKWEGFSHFQVQWMSGAWVWGFASPGQRKAFYRKGPRPEMTTEGAIPEEYLRIDIVLDVKYTNHIDIRTDEIDRARIREVGQALIKYKGLGYEDAVWEKVPEPEDGDRWTDFVSAYNDWVLGRYTHIPRSSQLRARIDKLRNQDFKDLECTAQPEPMTGGELMKYQLEGLNWMYYQWHSQRNGILADEMGLGKTIQVIAFLTMMALDHNCFPFLVVVPNSTCPNWRREIKQWAPTLRVVAYYGSATARQMASEYELFPNKSKDLHCHVVVTSYEAITDENSRRFFKSVSWQGLIVDEGQRLKNDQSILHNTLAALKIPFRMLLTGTPLQNNARELFNLLQFLEDSIDAQQMEQEYANMTNENIAKLHDLIRPYILRRTKAQVLTFLPPMGQIILPVSMTNLQKKLYKSIMAKNPELLRALFNQKTLKSNERSNMNNILMQLRKCLCHPFVYSQAIEERNLQASALHRNLVEASSKLQLLELLLPQLRARGHRVLIFSQFLDMLNIVEDFLDGLALPYQRLDGSINSLTKQKRIDEFNAPGSPLFAFLLSTRAGGVGINLATADTVIILDPDFNPHQDIQALSRAHRIGQTKKVLCFQLMTRASAEEKIVQIGRKKMALDHVVVDQLDAEDLEDRDVESILRYGAAELFNGSEANDIRYDEASIEKLLDRSHIENTSTGVDKSAEAQFSFARVWANDQEQMNDNLESGDQEAPPDPGLWDKILKERERIAAEEAAAKAEAFGRGRRARATVNYDGDGRVISRADDATDEEPEPTATDNAAAAVDRTTAAQRARKKQYMDSDTDFQAESSEDSEPENEANASRIAEGDLDLENDRRRAASRSKFLAEPITTSGAQQKADNQSHPPAADADIIMPDAGVQHGSYETNGHALERHTMSPAFHKRKQEVLWKRAKVNYAAFHPAENEPFLLINNEKVPATWNSNQGMLVPKYPICQACVHSHPTGSCPLKIAGVELCPLCGIAHFGIARQCPHVRSETMVRLMLDQLRNSPEDRHIVDLASKYLKGVKGHLVQNKKRAREQQEARAKGLHYPSMQPLGQGLPTDYGAPADATAGTAYDQLETMRSAGRFLPYPRFDNVSAPQEQPQQAEKDVEQRLMEALGA